MTNKRFWFEGTVLLGVLLDRLGGGQQIITRADAEKYITSMAVEFKKIDDDTVTIRVGDDLRKSEVMWMTDTLADALPREIARVQAKRERWLEYEKDAGPQANFKLGLFVMKAAIDEGVAALASGDIARMLVAHAELKGFNDDD